MRTSNVVSQPGFPGVLILSCLMFALAGCDSKDTPSANNLQDPSQTNPAETAKTNSAENVATADSQKSAPSLQDDSGKQTAGAVDQSVESTPTPNVDAAETDEGDESPFAEIALPEEEMDPPDEYREVHTIDLPKTWTRVLPEGKGELWFDASDPAKKKIIAGGVVCLRRGGLEMFICPLYTKEHESVIAVNALSSEIHAGLLVCGAKPGSPVQWHPEYKAAHGPKVHITVMWKEGDKIIERNARQMVRDFKTKKALAVDWIFGGSQTYTDPEDGQTVYYGDGGELVCLSNFSTATMDLPINSPNSNDDLYYEAFTENIPPPGTKVYVIMQPEVVQPDADKTDDDKDADAEKKPPSSTENSLRRTMKFPAGE